MKRQLPRQVKRKVSHGRQAFSQMNFHSEAKQAIRLPAIRIFEARQTAVSAAPRRTQNIQRCSISAPPCRKSNSN